MTDADDDDKLDLGAFGLAEDKAQADRVIGPNTTIEGTARSC